MLDLDFACDTHYAPNIQNSVPKQVEILRVADCSVQLDDLIVNLEFDP